MGGPIVRLGQPMVLPGVAFQITTGEPMPDVADGVVGYLGQANRGTLGSSNRVYGLDQLSRTYGKPGVNGNTMDGVIECYKGGAQAVEVIRVGSTSTPAAKASFSFVDTSTAPGVTVLRIDAKDQGTDGNAISVAFRVNASNSLQQDMVIYDSGLQREVHTAVTGSDAAAAFVAQLALDGSDLVAVTKLATGSGQIKNVSSTALAGGANPTITNADYAAALDIVGRRPVRTIVVDSTDPAVHAIVRAGIDNLVMSGRRRIGVVGQPTSVIWNTRIANNDALADPACIFVGGAFEYQDTQGNWIVVSGYKAAARHAGELSILPLGRQMTLRPEPGAQRMHEAGLSGLAPSDDQLAQAVAHGMVVWTQSDTGRIVTLEGSTSYKNGDPAPIWADSADLGWSKSRLILTRFRVMDAIYAAWEPLIPDATNNDAGRESFIREAKNIIERQYQPSGAVGDYAITIAVDPAPTTDQTTFMLDMQTPDGLERVRLVGSFRR